MSRTKTQIHEGLTSIILFLRLFKTYEIGQLLRICQLLDQQSSLYDDKTFSRLLVQFIVHLNEQNKKNHTQQQYLGLIIVQSLIYNLYKHNNRNGMNNSIYSNSLMLSSASHINANDQSVHSLKHYESIDDHFATNFVTFVQDFILDQELKKKLKQMIDRGSIKAGDGINQNQRYIDILIQTIEYILNKQGKLQKNGQFQYVKETIISKTTLISSHFEKKNLKVLIAQVNKIIFSSKLNRIVFMLEQASQRIYFSLLRIYFGEMPDQEQSRKQKRAKYFSSISYSGEQMLLNLSWAYITSISNKNSLFDISKNPLFRLIQSYLLCFYMPVFRSFSEVVSKCCKYDFTDNVEFYKVCETTINKDLSQFIEKLPHDLVDYLRQLYRIILSSQIKSAKKQTIQTISSIALTGVKKLLVYSLLAKPALIQGYYSQGVDLQKYESACNFTISLFFKSSLKKYQGVGEEFDLITSLTKTICNQLDQKIIGSSQQDADFDQFERSSGIRSYSIQQPILNHDYQILAEFIRNIEFTPKDLKEFQMHKKSQLSDKYQFAIYGSNETHSFNNTNTNFFSNNLSIQQENYFSPMQRAKKDTIEQNESIDIFLNAMDQAPLPAKEEIDLLTWMTMGGNRDYETQTRGRTTSPRKLKQMKKFPTFSRQKIREIQGLYEKYQRIIS